MARRVVSVVRASASGALRTSDPVLEANAYALAEDIDLAIVLRGRGVELAVAGCETDPDDLAGVALPPGAIGQDLRGLVESGIAVLADARDAAALGLDGERLVEGVRLADEQEIAEVLRTADAVLAW